MQQALHLLFTALAGANAPLFPSSGHVHSHSATRFERLVLHRTGKKEDPLVDAYRAALKQARTVPQREPAKAPGASKWLEAARHG